MSVTNAHNTHNNENNKTVKEIRTGNWQETNAYAIQCKAKLNYVHAV